MIISTLCLWVCRLFPTHSHTSLSLSSHMSVSLYLSLSQAEEMINEIRSAFKEALDQLSWMDAQTRQAAKDKVPHTGRQTGTHMSKETLTHRPVCLSLVRQMPSTTWLASLNSSWTPKSWTMSMMGWVTAVNHQAGETDRQEKGRERQSKRETGRGDASE